MTEDIEGNFWELFQEFKVIDPFSQIYKGDTSRKKNESSMVMWFVHLCWSRDSKFSSMEITERYWSVGEDFMKDKAFYNKNKSVIDMLVDKYIKITMGPIMRALVEAESMMDSRNKLLRQMVEEGYSRENWKEFDAIQTSSEKMMANLITLRNKANEEKQEGVAKGGKTLSLLDRKRI